MVLLRAPLGTAGSLAPTTLNVIQTVGFTVFEVIVVASAARAAARSGPNALWILGAGALTTALVLGGPLVVVRRVLRMVALPLTLAGGVYLTIWLLLHGANGALHPTGALTFWQGVDLALAGTLSYAPLVPDYARFGRGPAGAMAGTALGSTAAAVWFLILGVLLAAAGAADPMVGLGPSVGAVALAALALAETDKPFADLYSAVISIQNARPAWPAPMLAVVLGVFVTAIALLVGLGSFGSFLALIGACFVPLVGVLIGHAARWGSYPVRDLFRPDGAFGRLSLRGFGAWAAGFIVYEWISPAQVPDLSVLRQSVESLVPPLAATSGLTGFGASLPSFIVACALAFLLAHRRDEVPDPALERA
jgi:NCS1 family nucleobase:cation symporter-1